MPVSGSIKAAVLWRYSVRSFAIAKRMKAMEIVNRSASKLSTVSHTLSNAVLVEGDADSMAPNGARNRYSAPCANSMKIAGQRDTRGSLRPRQNS